MATAQSDLDNALEALRKSTVSVKRTQEAHQYALEKHQEAVVEVERVLKETHASVEAERDTLANWRQELDEQQALIGDGLLKDELLEELPAENEAAPDVDEAYDRPADVGGKGGWLLPSAREGDDRGRHSGRGGGQAWSADREGPSSGRERSRSRDRGRDRRGSSTEELVKEKIDRLGLDSRCADQVLAFPTEEALDMLSQVTDHIRNPSAFVMNMCKRKQQEASQPPPQRPDDRLNEKIESMSLDGSCSRVLHQLPVHEAMHILDSVDEGVRNPSAFVMSKAHSAMKGGGKGAPPPTPAERVDTRAAELGLDASSLRMLSEISPEQALEVMDSMGQEVRNPSAFVTAECRKVSSRTQQPRGDNRDNRDYSDYSRGGGGGHSADRGGGGGHGGGGIERQVHDLAQNLELDDHCVSELGGINVEDAVGILDRLARALPDIRNRSAFVHAEVRKCKQVLSDQRSHQPDQRSHQPDQSVARSGTTSGTRGPTKAVPCRFFAQGRCTKGTDCNFSHNL